MRRPVLLIQPKAKCASTSSILPSDFRPLSCPLRLLYFQQLPTVKFCNSSVLITIRIAGDGGSPLSSSSFPYILPSSVSSKFCVFTLFKKLPGWGVFLPILVHPERGHESLETFQL